METTDRMISCRTCGKEFVFTAREQEFFTSKGFDAPRHCPDCRAQRKREKAAGAAEGGAGSEESMPHAGGRQWTEVICASCGKPTSVPFKPTTGRPVYCRECFASQRSSEAPRAKASQPDPQPVPPPADPPTPRATSVLPVPSHILEEDMGPLPEIDPAPDEEGEITVAEFIPAGGGYGATPEEINPEFEPSQEADGGEGIEESQKSPA